MDAKTTPGVVQFEQFRLDRRAGRLLRCDGDGNFVPVSLGSRAISVLCALIDRNGDLVSKDEMMAAVWPGTVVEESNLTVQVSALRRALDQGRGNGSCIQTVAGRGYRFTPAVVRVNEAPPELERHVQSEAALRPPRRGTKVIVVSAAAIAGLLAATGWWLVQRTWPTSSIATTQQPTSDWRMSTTIVPFQNSSGDPGQDALAAEITQQVTERIATSGNGPVIPALTIGLSQGGLADLPTIRRDHHVHFALTGNVRRQDGRLIVSAALYDTAEARAVWGRPINVPDGPSALTTIGQIIYENWWQTSVDQEAWHAAHDHPDRLDPRDLVNMALTTPLTTPTRTRYLEKMSLVDRALELDPSYYRGLERRARFHAEFVLLGYSSDPATDLAIAMEAADHMLAIDPNRYNSLRVKATVLRARGDWPAAAALVRRVLALQPTEANRHFELGECLMAEARHQEALASFETAKQFAGGTDSIGKYDANIAAAYLALGEFAEAIASARLAIAELPPNTGRIGELPWLALIAATSLSGKDEAARADLEAFRATTRSWRSMAEVGKWAPLASNAYLLAGLRRAGMPAE